ncbi:uncharacterized protein METZ01_LOCUS256404, partial [marine metagenome]
VLAHQPPHPLFGGAYTLEAQFRPDLAITFPMNYPAASHGVSGRLHAN